MMNRLFGLGKRLSFEEVLKRSLCLRLRGLAVDAAQENSMIMKVDRDDIDR
jgi:hypothetical protein